MFRSAGFRFFIVVLLALLMLIPLLMVSDVVRSRQYYHDETLESVGAEWGGPQTLSGPALVLPVTEEVTEKRTREVIDPATGRVMMHEASGQTVKESYDYTFTAERASIVLLPNDFKADLTSQTETRYRGIFQVPVYRATVEMGFDFPLDQAEKQITGAEKIDWAKARLMVDLATNRSLRGTTRLSAGATELALEPREEGGAGLVAALGDPRLQGAYALHLELNGADSLRIAPVGRQSAVRMQSDWPHPSFQGAFLPNEREIGAEGFTASWDIPHLARNLAQIGRAEPGEENAVLDEAIRASGFGFAFYQPNDFYQKAWRASKYGLLTVALTFLTVFLIDASRARPVHPVQYLLIGLAQAIFILLMLSYAEQIGFGPAYALSAGATAALITGFGFLGLKLGRRALVLGLSLVVLYAVLYLILQSTDYALLAGATLAFLALAATMYATRNEEWYGPAGSGWFGRTPKAPPPLPAEPGTAPATGAEPQP